MAHRQTPTAYGRAFCWFLALAVALLVEGLLVGGLDTRSASRGSEEARVEVAAQAIPVTETAIEHLRYGMEFVAHVFRVVR